MIVKRICIWYELMKKPWGGSNSFLSTLAGEFKRLGLQVDSTPQKSDQLILVNSWSRGKGRYLDVNQVKNIKQYTWISGMEPAPQNRRTPIIHRLDGIAQFYGRKDAQADEIQLAVAELADDVIFQSEYSHQSFLEYGTHPAHFEVIHNAVDGNLFYPANKITQLGRTINLVAVSWSDNLMKGFSKLTEIAKLPEVKLFFIGNWNQSVDPGGVNCLGIKSRTQIAGLLRRMDALIHPAENDPCSNVILEGLASGLPVLFTHSGGNPELAGKYGVPLYEDPGVSVQELRQKFTDLHSKLLENRSDFLIEKCAEKYLAVFEKCLNP